MAYRYEDLRDEFKASSSGDAWGDVMGAWFRVADSLYFHHGRDTPAEWKFRPSPMGRADDPSDDDFAAMCDEADPDELLKFGMVLDRAADHLRSKGLDY